MRDEKGEHRDPPSSFVPRPSSLSKWCDVDVPAALARASEPIFLLSERGAVVFANPALHDLFGIPLGDRYAWRELERGPLKPPTDLPPGDARRLEVPIGDGRWVQVVFHSLQDVTAGALGVLGIVRPIDAPPVAPASDANLFAIWERLREEQRRRFGFDLIPARSDAGKRLLHQLKTAAGADSPVLFVGAAGVGKRTLANVLHHQGKDRGWSATLDAEVLSPEQQREFLFGETGVLRQSGPGRVVVRRLSLLAIDVQKELAVAHEASGRTWRLLATERAPLEAALAAERIDPPLFYLATRLVVAVPPLRERREDIGDFAAQSLRQRQSARGGELLVPTPAAVAALEGYDWPGNLREFELVVAAAAEKATAGRLDLANLPPSLRRGAGRRVSKAEIRKPPPLDQVLEAVERRMFAQAHALFRGNKSKAAEHLGLSRARFIRRWEQLRMDETRPNDTTIIEAPEPPLAE